MSKIDPELLRRFYSLNKQSPSRNMAIRTLKVLYDNRVEDKISVFVTNPKYTSYVDAIYYQTIGLDDEASGRQVQHMCTRSRLSYFDFKQKSYLLLEQDNERWRLIRRQHDLLCRYRENLMKSNTSFITPTVSWKPKSLPHYFYKMQAANSPKEIDRYVYKCAGCTRGAE